MQASKPVVVDSYSASTYKWLCSQNNEVTDDICVYACNSCVDLRCVIANMLL